MNRKFFFRKSAIFGMFLYLILSGCSSTQKIKLYIDSTGRTNAGKPLYVVASFMSEQDFIRSTYREITDKMFQKESKKQFSTEVIFPGNAKEVSITVPAENKLPLAVFFVFLDPGDKWKTLVPFPIPSSWALELGTDQISDRTFRVMLGQDK